MKNDDKKLCLTDALALARLQPLRLQASEIGEEALMLQPSFMERLENLEVLALNQTLIIEQLSSAVCALLTPSIRKQVIDRSTEELLDLLFLEGVPLGMLDLAVEWQQKFAAQDIMQFSE